MQRPHCGRCQSCNRLFQKMSRCVEEELDIWAFLVAHQVDSKSSYWLAQCANECEWHETRCSLQWVEMHRCWWSWCQQVDTDCKLQLVHCMQTCRTGTAAAWKCSVPETTKSENWSMHAVGKHYWRCPVSSWPRWHAGAAQSDAEARSLQAHVSVWREAQGRYTDQRRRRRSDEVGWALRDTAWRQTTGERESLYLRETRSGPVTCSCDQDVAMHAKTARCCPRRDGQWDLDCRRRQVDRATKRAHEAYRCEWNRPSTMERRKNSTTLQRERRRCRLQLVSLPVNSRSRIQGVLLVTTVTDCASMRPTFAYGAVRMRARAWHSTRDAHEQTIR